MANNYVQFSELWDFGTGEAAELFLKLSQACQMIVDGEWSGDQEELDGEAPDPGQEAFLALPKDQREKLAEEAEFGGMFEYEQQSNEPSVIWVYSDEAGNLDLAARVAQVVLAAMEDHTTILTATSAGTCSKPRAGEFGGGWVAVSAKDFRGGNTWTDAEEAAKKMRKKGKKVA